MLFPYSFGNRLTLLGSSIRTLVIVISRNQMEITVEQAKSHLKKNGWSYRNAAEELGYSFTHFAWVLSERRTSLTLLRSIMALTKRIAPPPKGKETK